MTFKSTKMSKEKIGFFSSIMSFAPTTTAAPAPMVTSTHKDRHTTSGVDSPAKAESQLMQKTSMQPQKNTTSFFIKMCEYSHAVVVAEFLENNLQDMIWVYPEYMVVVQFINGLPTYDSDRNQFFKNIREFSDLIQCYWDKPIIQKFLETLSSVLKIDKENFALYCSDIIENERFQSTPTNAATSNMSTSSTASISDSAFYYKNF